MKIKPTMRKAGYRMCTFTIKVHIEIEDVILALIYNHAVYGESLDLKRQKAMKLTVQFFQDFGTHGWASVNDEMRDGFGTLCAIRAAELFPDLAGGVDLSAWGLTRVTPL